MSVKGLSRPAVSIQVPQGAYSVAPDSVPALPPAQSSYSLVPDSVPAA